MSIVNFLETAIASTLRMSTPLILGALGALFSKRVGVLALGLESMVSMGAFTAVLGAFFTQNPYIGIICGMMGGMFFAFLHAVLTVKYHVNHVLSGLGLNLMTKAFIPLMLQIIWDSSSNSPMVPSLPTITMGVFKDIPIMNSVFYSQSPLTYFTWMLIPILWVVLFKTVFGLRLRIIGNNPYAASTAGIKVNRYKFIGVLLCGILAGLAGTFLSISHLNIYSDGMSAERGYISIVINVLGNSNPIGILFAGLMFGAADATQIILQGSNIPSYLLGLTPYVITLIALILAKGKNQGGAYIGKHFIENN